METLWITLTVHVRDSKYKYDKPSGEADVELKVLPTMVKHLNLADIFQALLAAAMAQFDAGGHDDATE